MPDVQQISDMILMQATRFSCARFMMNYTPLYSSKGPLEN
jgi:hypothetical protein